MRPDGALFVQVMSPRHTVCKPLVMPTLARTQTRQQETKGHLTSTNGQAFIYSPASGLTLLTAANRLIGYVTVHAWEGRQLMGPQEPPRDGTPGVDRDAFHCPNCGAYAAQHWGDVYLQGTNLSWPFPEWRAAKCSRCDKPNVWRESNLIWPPSRLGVRPHPDMPDDVRVLYEEAQDVSGVSKKSAAALLRLALQVLVDELERGNENLDKKIGKLVARGLDPGVQQAMDVVRVVG